MQKGKKKMTFLVKRLQQVVESSVVKRKLTMYPNFPFTISLRMRGDYEKMDFLVKRL